VAALSLILLAAWAGTALAASPSVRGVTPANGATGVPLDDGVAATVNLPSGAEGIDADTLTSSTVRLIRTSDNAQVSANRNTSGIGDVIVLQPTALLSPSTTYRFEVTSGVKTLSGASFIPFSSTFTTGTQTSGGGALNVSFVKVSLPTATGRPFTSVTIGPDGKLYAGTLTGEIVRFALHADGTTGSAEVINSIRTANGGNRIVLGLAFDSSSTAASPILWVSHGFAGLSDNLDWTGKISRLSGPGLANVQDYVIGLPRSIRDHMTNSISFGPDGALYVNQGSNTAMGFPDEAWDMRNERVLTASLLRVNLKAIGAPPVNVKSEFGGTYNPFAPGAPVTVYASGIRNAFDHVWHTNGSLYIPTNGSAAGGNVPKFPSLSNRPATCHTRLDAAKNGDYTGPNSPALVDVKETQSDFLFRVVKGGYYGHPNPKRCEWVLNGGNPTAGTDPAEVPDYPVGTQPDRNWRGYAFDFGTNKSPNGAIEYRSKSFHGELRGKLIVVRYSLGDDLIVLTPRADGNIVSSQTGIPGFTKFNDPLDLTEDRSTGDIYVTELAANKITLLRPTVPPTDEPPSGRAPRNVVRPTTTGRPRVGAILRASPGTWSGTKPISYGFQWERCRSDGRACINIPGANRRAHLVNLDDVRALLRVDVVAVNSAGTGSKPSAKIGPIRNPLGCTMLGTLGADVLGGAGGRDVICALGGNDQLLGRGGNDVLVGGGGGDALFGGRGRDLLLADGDGGGDVLRGGSGFDRGRWDGGDSVLGIEQRVAPRQASAVLAAAGPAIELQNVDGAPFADRLVFNGIANPLDERPHDQASITVKNVGTQPLVVSGLSISGPWQRLAPATLPASIAPGGQLTVTLKFAAPSNGVVTGTLTISSNDGAHPSTVVQLGGFRQTAPQGNNEPSLAKLMQVFGYKTSIPETNAGLANDGHVEAVGDEVLAPYWLRADTSKPVTVRELAAFHAGGRSSIFWFAKGTGKTSPTLIATHNGFFKQTLLPPPAGTFVLSAPTGGSFSPAGAFGFDSGDEWSEPAFNDHTPDLAKGCTEPCGHHVRFFRIRDRSSTIVPNTWLMVVDLDGVNYDYNDNVYLLRNLRPEKVSTQPPTNSAPPTLAGRARVGSVLRAGRGDWTNDPTSFAYQWERCLVDAGCTDIEGAIGANHLVVLADLGARIRVRVLASNTAGTASAESSETAIVTNPLGCTILGTNRGDVLRGTPGRDVICALRGNDRLYGGRGRDLLLAAGDGGGDVLVGGRGFDRGRWDRGDSAFSVERRLR
jgi:Big-like domain-containing protein/hemolysin type calcium-binding protein/strictosidine synthase-like protein